MDEKRQVRVGMIGYSFMGKVHSNAYRSVPFFFSLDAEPILQAICGRNEKNVEEQSQKLRWKSYETDWKQLIKRDDIDLIDISTPNNTHYEIVLAAAKAGKHIICEKPLANTLEEAKEMLKAVNDAGVIHMISHNYRFSPAVQFAKKLISEGRIGKIHHIRATYLQDWLLDPSYPMEWRLKKEISGSGTLGDLGSHIIDLARFLVGEIDEVVGMMKTFIDERPLDEVIHESGGMGKVTVDDTSSFLARFDNGALGNFETTRFAGGNKAGNRFEINGDKGSIRWDLENMNNLEVYLVDDEPGLQGFRTINCTEEIHPYADAYWPAGHIIGYEHTFINQISELIKGISTGNNPAPNFEDGVRNQQVLHAIAESIETKRWVKVDKDLD
jgi:predicted dehydrogenase